MMNQKKMALLSLLFLNAVLVYSQNIEGRITYIATAKNALENIKKNSSKNEKNKTRKSVNELYENAKDVKAILKFNNLVSEYFVIKKMDLTSKEGFNFAHVMAGSENKYYTYNKSNTYDNNTLDCYLLGECFLIKNLLPKWELKQETKMIQGFQCYKAIVRNPRTGKQTIEVWYTPKIPYSYGVMNFYGLPGVILEFNKRTIRISAIKIELNPTKKIIIKEPKKIKKLSNEEFEKRKRKAFYMFYEN